ncbi:MAG: DNA-directed RNA polymerase subunit beta, partial [Bacteroidales bacterium]|nr:DNA-directed RNA polymerase subunit beta [Bacteroidales bacterium]
GPNIGLISSLCVYARINELGFIETPYRKVEDGKVDMTVKGIVYMSAEEEEEKMVAQANIHLDSQGAILDDRIKCRFEADYPVVGKEDVHLVDVAPNQIASIAASLIPFLEHDDANRALMGSNMMRQAVPLVKPESPIVGTGLESYVVQDSRTQITARGKGEVVYVDAREIHIKYEMTENERFVSFDPEITVYRLPLYRKTNQNTSITLKPIVKKGERVDTGQILSEGYGTEKGELALGRNLKVAFMPWQGYNFEDAIVISERLLREDVFTSIHVDEYTMEVRDTKRGMEELTSDIPNVSEEATKDLDENGIIRIGANIEPGDILIGKITPKGESDPSPEEKLLRAIFGDKAGDVKDASLKASPSLRGTVIDKRLFSRVAKENSKKGKSVSKNQIQHAEENFTRKTGQLRQNFLERLFALLQNKSSQGISDLYGVEIIGKGVDFKLDLLDMIDYENINPTKWTTDKSTNNLIKQLINNYLIAHKEFDAELKRIKYNLTIGDELPTGIMQLAKVYIAKKRKIRVGDKMAGRHGNKGIVAKVVRDEDMPFLEDGSTVD